MVASSILARNHQPHHNLHPPAPSSTPPGPRLLARPPQRRPLRLEPARRPTRRIPAQQPPVPKQPYAHKRRHQPVESPSRNHQSRNYLRPPAPSSTPPESRLPARPPQRRPPRLEPARRPTRRHRHPIAVFPPQALLMHNDLAPLLNDSVYRALDAYANAPIKENQISLPLAEGDIFDAPKRGNAPAIAGHSAAQPGTKESGFGHGINTLSALHSDPPSVCPSELGGPAPPPPSNASRRPSDNTYQPTTTSRRPPASHRTQSDGTTRRHHPTGPPLRARRFAGEPISPLIIGTTLPIAHTAGNIHVAS